MGFTLLYRLLMSDNAVTRPKRLLAQGIDPNAKKQADEKILQEKRDKTRSSRVVAKS
ncbi:phage integrase [Salmonella enterica subsp. enterica]|uniref:Phage integrase n=1 Tax=Salmonella enterica I TaxID=59201 RepID=A0A379WTE4_SALET|nr:phage integrase [Salmonella enterica subsp. enterica]